MCSSRMLKLEGVQLEGGIYDTMREGRKGDYDAV